MLELEWRRVGGQLYLAALERRARCLLDARDGQASGPLPDTHLLNAVRAVRPGLPLHDAVMLASEDGYYYSHHRQQALPVVRVRFRDPAGTTFYADPASGQLAGYADRHSKWRRWLFNGLHQLDFVRARPAWDVLVASLCALGVLLAATGLVLGWRRLRRHA